MRRLQATAVGGDAEFMRSSRIMDFLHHIVTFVTWAIVIFVAYWWLTFSLRRFPYTRFWGESLRGFLLGHLSLVGTAILGALPSLFTVLIIVLLTRFVERIVNLLFQAIEERRISIPWIYPETAESTRKLIAVGLWLFAVAIAYPYLPGSESDAFKGVSVFVGLMVSLGATGLVNQVMSGFTLTYSRALRLGDFVEVGDVAGTVTQMGTLSTKIRTPRNEDVTIPNAVIVGQTITNYSRRAETEGVFVPTSITIGYDVAWRQVEALLLLAAARTPGIRRQPAPIVMQTALEDACVKYTLLFCLEDPTQRAADARGRSREHPRRVQRVRGADHVATVRSRSLDPQSRSARPLVRCAGAAGRPIRVLPGHGFWRSSTVARAARGVAVISPSVRRVHQVRRVRRVPGTNCRVSSFATSGLARRCRKAQDSARHATTTRDCAGSRSRPAASHRLRPDLSRLKQSLPPRLARCAHGWHGDGPAAIERLVPGRRPRYAI